MSSRQKILRSVPLGITEASITVVKHLSTSETLLQWELITPLL